MNAQTQKFIIPLQKAKELAEKISTHLTCNSKKLNNLVGPDIQQFISSNQQFISFDCLENQETTLDLLLGEIIKQFIIIKKLINLPNKNPNFFQNNSAQSLENPLKIIREELNKFKTELSLDTKASTLNVLKC